MREATITLAGTELTLCANFRASVELAKTVADPLLIMQETALKATLNERGLPYTPKFEFTIQNITEIVYIGAKAGGSKLDLEAIQDLCFDAGFIAAQIAAVDYLTMLVGPTTEEELPKGDGGKKNEAAG